MGGPRRSPPAARRSGGQIILTLGTTGTPKGAHRGARPGPGALISLLSAVPLRAGDVGIAEACVVGVDDERWGQRLPVYVVPARPSGGEPLTAEGVRDFVRDRLATYKVPRDVVFLDELPRNATGKILRRNLTG